MSKAPDLDFFRTLADHSENGLLATVMQLAIEKKTAAVLNFVRVLAERGTTGPMFDSGSATEFKALGEDRAQFTFAIAIALGPLGGGKHRSTDWSAEQREIFATTLQTLKGHPRSSELLSQFAFNLAGTTQDPQAFKTMADNRVNFIEEERTRIKGSYASVPVFKEALHQGNTSAAIALLPTLSDTQAASHLREIADGVTATSGTRSTTFDAANGLLQATESMLNMQATGGLLDLLTAFDQRLGAEATVQPRAQLMAMHLNQCIRTGTPWDQEPVQALAGEGGLDGERSSLAKSLRAREQGNLMQIPPFNNLIDASLRAHCAPTLALCAPILRQLVNDDRNPLNIGLAIEQGKHALGYRDCDSTNYPCIVERFKATLNVMTENGHHHDEAARVNGKTVPSMHYLARTERTDRAQKQIGMLEIGLSSKEKDERGMVPLSHVKGADSKASWVSVERSFSARSKAHNLLAELDLDSAPSP